MKKKVITKKRILIVGDHPMMRQGLAQLIDHEPDLEACGEADTAAQALKRINADNPDLVLADISLPDRSGLELIKDVQALHTRLAVLVVSMHDEALYAERVLRAGGRGYIMKQEGGKRLMQAIRRVLSGQIYVSEKMSVRILEIFSGHRAEVAHSPVERLSDREFEVFQLIGQGKGTRDIAQRLRLSVKTVEVHRANIKHKLELDRGTDLVRYAIRWTEVQNPS
jgi:DNA-binding NarL/FixJ family response regulator